MASEIIDAKKYGKAYNNKVDMYSLGCIIYELFNLYHQYYDDKKHDDIQEIDETIYDKKWQKLIDKLLDTNPEKRLNINEVFTEYLD